MTIVILYRKNLKKGLVKLVITTIKYIFAIDLNLWCQVFEIHMLDEQNESFLPVVLII